MSISSISYSGAHQTATAVTPPIIVGQNPVNPPSTGGQDPVTPPIIVGQDPANPPIIGRLVSPPATNGCQNSVSPPIIARHHMHFRPVSAGSSSSSAANPTLLDPTSDYLATGALSSVGSTLNLTA